MIQPGTLLQNRYRVSKQIGHGGMGAVYIATDERFRSTVAIKQTFFDDPTLSKAFEREAHLLNHLRHAALPKVSDHFIEEMGQFLVMEYIEGSDFSELLHERNGAFPLSLVLEWADALLDALDYLHAQQPPVVHRDIKPQNLKRTPRGEVVLLDFGLAKGAPTEALTGADASVFGYSRNYAPLEQIQGAGTDPRSDLYSLGATLYHLMTGAPPVDALTRATAIINNQPDPLRPAHFAHAQVPPAVGEVIQRALAQNPAHRPQTAAEMRAALRHAASDDARDVQPMLLAAITRQDDPSFYETTVLERFVHRADVPQAAPDATQHAARPTSPPPQSATVLRDTTVAETPRRAPRPRGLTYTPSAFHEPPPTPARKSSKLLVAAVVALLVACASVPLLLSRRSAATPASSGAQTETAPGADAQSNAPATTQGTSPGEDSNAAASEAQPAPTPDTAAPSSGEQATTAAQPATSNADANNNGGASPNGSNAGAAGAYDPTTSAGSSGRPTLVINAPAPADPTPTPVDHSAAAVDAARRAEEAARRAEESRQNQERERPPRPEERRPPPPAGWLPPPPDGRRPPPRRP